MNKLLLVSLGLYLLLIVLTIVRGAIDAKSIKFSIVLNLLTSPFFTFGIYSEEYRPFEDNPEVSIHVVIIGFIFISLEFEFGKEDK